MLQYEQVLAHKWSPVASMMVTRVVSIAPTDTSSPPVSVISRLKEKVSLQSSTASESARNCTEDAMVPDMKVVLELPTNS